MDPTELNLYPSIKYTTQKQKEMEREDIRRIKKRDLRSMSHLKTRTLCKKEYNNHVLAE